MKGSAPTPCHGPRVPRFPGISILGCLIVLFGLLLSTLGSARAASGDVAGRDAAVDAVAVRLTIYRGNETLPDGTRAKPFGAVVEGVAEYRLARPAQAGERLWLLNFAGFMKDEPVELDEVAIAGYLAGPHQPGALEVHGAWGIERVQRLGERRDVVLTLTPGTQTVTVRYRVTVPRRFWPFGCAQSRCSLAGALAPLPSSPARGGRFLPADGRVVQPVKWTVETARFGSVPSADPREGQPRTAAHERALRGQELVVVGGNGELSAYPSVLWGRRWHRSRGSHKGVTVQVLHPKRRPSGQVPNERNAQLRHDTPGQVLQVAREVVDVLEAAGQLPPPGTELTVVQGPLRSTVAQFHPGAVLISDQTFELFPSERFLKFHRVALARSTFDALLYGRYVGMQDPSTAQWLPSALGFALVARWERLREHPDEFAADILRNFTFMPAVDRFLYTEQASFSSAYFRGVDDDFPLRNHPLLFSHELPTGRRIHEKLSDLVPAQALSAFYAAVTERPGGDPILAASRAYGHELGWFFDQWLGPYPAVEYLIGDVRSEPTDTGWHHEVDVVRRAPEALVEPVQLLVEEKKTGKQHFLVWNGELDPPNADLDSEPASGVHTFELDTAEKLAVIRLDPRSRLVETPQGRGNIDPRFDNRSPASFRFLYTGAGFDVALSEFFRASTASSRLAAIAAFISFEASLRRDLRRTGHLLLLHNRETNIGVAGGINFWFGDKRNARRRRSRVRAFGNVDWLNATRLDPRGGVRLIQTLGLVDDTRRFSWWPDRGRQLWAGLSARQTLRVDEGPTDPVVDLTAAVSWTQLLPVAHGHVIATSVGVNAVVPLRERPEFRGLVRIGGIGGLSGYLADEVFGLASAMGRAEYRHVFVEGLPLNLAHLAWLRSLGGVAFGGVASVSDCESYGGLFTPQSVYAHAGYGLMGYLQILGVTPQLVRLDFAVPLVRRDGRSCLDQTFPDYLGEVQGVQDVGSILPRFNVNLLFAQPF